MKKQIIAALAVGVMAVTALPVGASADYVVTAGKTNIRL